MMDLTVGEIIKVLDCKAGDFDLSGNELVQGISIDSRTIGEKEIFFALKGENFDGHDFVEDAVCKSGYPAVVEKEIPEENIILVEDVLESLGILASYYRKKIDPLTVAITGSYGKSTTKEILGAILKREKSTLVSYRNYNNLIGVPLNIFNLQDEEIMILELATNRKGEINKLSEICSPDIGLITGIGDVHLKAFGDKMGVLKEKMGITGGLSGPLFVNGDDELLKELEYDKVFEVGSAPESRYRCRILQESIDGSIISVNGREFWTRTHSSGMTSCAFFAVALAMHLGLNPDKIQRGLQDFTPMKHRMDVRRIGKNTLIDDTYNSNPVSVLNAISYLSLFPGRKIAVLGPMLELGKKSKELHRSTGEKICGSVDILMCTGKEAKPFLRGCNRAIFAEDKEEAFIKLKDIIREGDTILFKSSRRLKLETLVEKVEEECCTFCIR